MSDQVFRNLGQTIVRSGVCSDLKVLGHVGVPVLMERLDQHHGCDLVRETLCIAPHIGASERMPDQYVR